MQTKTIKRKYPLGEMEYEVNEFGQANGQYKAWNHNGNIQLECIFKNGQKHGLNKVYWSNGNTQIECVFVKNKKHGLYKSFHDNGKIYSISTTKKNQFIGTRIVFYY
jgi:antitoxin component YwqK of YwqJK toxin-antitoxin module